MYDISTLSKAAQAIDTHSTSALLTPSPQLEAAISNSSANKLPTITISPLQGRFLALQCQLINAKSVLEIGTLGGYSTIWFASTGAKVTSIEINPKRREVAMQNTTGLDVDIILGAALDVLPTLHSEGRKFDFIFIDADWGEQWEYFQWAVKMLNKGGCIYVDNVIRELLESEAVYGTESLLTKVGKMEGVDATLVPTLNGSKVVEEMYDGFLIATVRSG